MADPAPRLTGRQLAYLVAVAQHESVAGAAAALGIAPASVSAAIAEVERVTGAQLFVRRHARGMVMTAAGRAMVAEARVLLAAMRELETAHRPDRFLAGRLDLGCIVTLAPHLLPPLLRDLRALHPELTVHGREGDQEALLDGLQSGRLDAALMFDFDIPSSVRGVPLRAFPLQAVLPAGHPLADSPAPDLRLLAAEPFILLDLPRSRDYLLSAFAELGLAPRIGHRVASPEMARGLVAQGFGYSLLNFCPPVRLPGQPPVVSRALAGGVRGARLVFARLHRARTPRSVEALLQVATRIAAGLAIATGSENPTPSA